MRLSRLNSVLSESGANAPLLTDLRVLITMVDTRDITAAPPLKKTVDLASRVLNSPDNSVLLRMLSISVDQILSAINSGKIAGEPKNNVVKRNLVSKGIPWVHRHVKTQLGHIRSSLMNQVNQIS